MHRGRTINKRPHMTDRERRALADANYARSGGVLSNNRGRPNVKGQPMSNKERRNKAAQNYNKAQLLQRPPNGPLLYMFYRSENARLRDNQGEVHNAASLGALHKSDNLMQYESAQPRKDEQYLYNLYIRQLHNEGLLNGIKALKLHSGSSAIRRKGKGSSETRRNNAGSLNGLSTTRRNNAGSLNGSSAERRNKAGSL